MFPSFCMFQRDQGFFLFGDGVHEGKLGAATVQIMAGTMHPEIGVPDEKIGEKPDANRKGDQFQMLQLGLGTGALTKFAHKYFKNAFVRAIELNPAVIVAAHVMFGLPHVSKNLDIIEEDAMRFVTCRKNRQSADLLQVDLYDATARGPVLSSRDFYQGCFDTLKEVGVMTVNLFGNHKSFKTNIENICDVFQDRVLVFPEVHDCNIIVIAFKGPKIDLNWATLASRAMELEKRYGLPAKLWPKKLREANWGQEQKLVI